ncbi:uncharacterized protein LOC141650977 [Silene latifolia]|uniref:uncharacterized protein LOC141650977 n=1 Tax=Silene latifolia TaxID=37657 RepID=UPI003D77F765
MPEQTFESSYYSMLDDPLFLSPTDQPNLQLTAQLFDGTNFIQWQRDVIQSLFSKNKTGFITGEVAVPPKTDKKYNQWVRVDLLVLCWILNSLEKNLRENLQYASSSKALWSEIVERYGQLNALELYDLKKDLSNVSQDNSSLIEYYSRLKCLWETIDNLDPIPQCTCGIMAKCSCQLLKRLLDREAHSKLIQLLMGLNAGYEHVQTTLLSMEPLPPINKALGLLQKIEKQKHINDSAGDLLSASAAYASKKRHNFSGPDTQASKRQKEDNAEDGFKHCTYCGRDGHVIEDCYKLKTCTFCNVKGHIQDHCYKYKAHLARKGKGKASGKGSNVHPRPSANNVDIMGSEADQDSQYELITPLQDCLSLSDPQTSQAAADFHQAHLSSDVIQGIISSVTQSVLMAISDSAANTESQKPNLAGSALKSSVNFAGIINSYAFAVNTCSSSSVWVVDIGGSDHMTSNLGLLQNLKRLKVPILVGLPDGTVKSVHHTGQVLLTGTLILQNVFYIPDFKQNLLSVGKLVSSTNLDVSFGKFNCLSQDLSSKRVIAVARRFGDLYHLDTSQFKTNKELASTTSFSLLSFKHCNNGICNAAKSVDHFLFHSRVGHTSFDKMHHMPHYVWGPYRVSSLSGATSFLTILDDHSRNTWTFLVQNKAQVPALVKQFIAFVETQFHKQIKIIRSDNGTEFFQVQCSQFFKDKGIMHQRSIVGRPQQNGRVERKHRHLLDTARELKIQSKVPPKFWGECLLTATYFINKMPTPVLNWKTPYELLFGSIPTFDELKVFGCQCYATMPVTNKDKFAPRETIFPYATSQDNHSLPLVTDISNTDLCLNTLHIDGNQQTPIESDSLHTDNSVFNSQDDQNGSSVSPTSEVPSVIQSDNGLTVQQGSSNPPTSDNPSTLHSDVEQHHSQDEIIARRFDRIRRPSVLLSDYQVTLPKANALHVKVLNEL